MSHRPSADPRVRHGVWSGVTFSGYGPMAIASVVTIAGNMTTGVLTARLLAPAGKGVVAAIVTWSWFSAYAYHIGLPEAATYAVANDPPSASRVTSTVLASTLVLSVLGLGITHLLLPVAYGRQSAEFIDLARTYTAMSVFIMFSQAAAGVLAGQARFRLLALLHVVAPAGAALALVALAVSSRFTLTAVLICLAASQGLGAIASVAFAVHRTGLGRPVLAEFSSLHRRAISIWPGTIATLTNGRLDLLLLPVFASTSTVGLYSVAANAASVLQGVAGNLGGVLLAKATRLSESARIRLIERSLNFMFLFSLVLAIALTLAARPLILLVYGQEYLEAVPLLIILVPGVTAWTMALFANRGLQSLDRPGQGSAIQVVGAVFMLGGLLVTLPRFGAYGAAWTSTVSYLLCFIFSYALLRGAGLSLGRLLLPWRN